MNNWQLPEGIDELTGEQAVAFESIRRLLLDLYSSWGYELVVPPMVEYIESLILTSDSVDQKTFKFLDSSSERMLGDTPTLPHRLQELTPKGQNQTKQTVIVTLMLFLKPRLMIFMPLDHQYRLAQNFMDIKVLKQILKLLS